MLNRHWYWQAAMGCFVMSLFFLILIWFVDSIWFLPWAVFIVGFAVFMHLEDQRHDHNFRWLTENIKRGMTSGMNQHEAEEFIMFVLQRADKMRDEQRI